ncbi:MAG: glycosyltransferase [Elusimicrobiota bacterium]
MSDKSNPKKKRFLLLIDYKLFIDDLERLFLDANFLVLRKKPADITVESFACFCTEYNPAFVFSVNFSPEIAFLCSMNNTPYVSWTIDPLPPKRLAIIQGTKPELCLLFVHRRSLADKMRSLGLTVEYLPLAASGELRKSVEDTTKFEKIKCTVSFVGSSLETEHRHLLVNLRRHGADPSFEKRLDDFLTEVIIKNDNELFTGFKEDGSDVPEWILKGLNDKFSVCFLADLLNGRLSNLLRIYRITALESFGINVYGDESWSNITRGYRGIAKHGEHLTLIYNASLMNLDIPRIYQRDIVTMRVFDILACGGLLLTEPSEDICCLFTDGRHILTYRNNEELIELVGRFSKCQELGSEIARAGSSEVLKNHLIEHRFRKILEFLRIKKWV